MNRSLATGNGKEQVGQRPGRHVPVQLGIGGLIDLAHAPLTNEGGHVVMAEPRTEFESHKLC